MKQKRFPKDFILVVIGQIISLFGNAVIRFALPLYLLNLTGSAALYGTVAACALIPSVLFAPIGGIVADRVNKRNIMVGLDFFTAGIILLFAILMHSVNLVVLMVITLMLLYGIAGAYQPSVQASVPALVQQEDFVAANSVINTVSSFASLIGPVIGGILYSAYGLTPVLWVCAVCFTFSAVMELFIHIPFEKQTSSGSILKILRADLFDSFSFIQQKNPTVGKVLLMLCGMNLFLSAMIIVALPYLVTEVLGFDADQANRLYGFAEGALAAGGLAGGMIAGIMGRKFTIQHAGNGLALCVLCVFPIGFVLLTDAPPVVCYGVLVLCCFAIMVFSTIFMVQMMAYIQAETPEMLIGKVIALSLTMATCAQPLGNALYGVLFQVCRNYEYAVVFFAGFVSLGIALKARQIFRKLT